MEISQIITTAPVPAPNRNTDTPTEFSENVDNQLAWDRVYVTEVNTWAEQANTLATEVNSNAVSAGLSATAATEAANLSASSANFKGRWQDLTGAATIPYSVSHIDVADSTLKNWQLINNIADITLSEPGVSSDWEIVPVVVNIHGDSTSTVSAVDITLTLSSTNFQDVTMSVEDNFIILPSAITLSKGYFLFIIKNSGDFRFGIKDSSGNFLGSVDTSEIGYIHLLDNSTVAGSWGVDGGADFIMNHLQTSCNAIATASISSCKLTSTELFVAFKNSVGDNGYCCVLTWGASNITISNILEFSGSGSVTRTSCCRMTDTVAIICYGASSKGYASAITWDSIDTLTLTDTYEFNGISTSYSDCVPIYPHATTGRIGIVYLDSSSYIISQVLSWDGSTIESDTAATSIYTSDSINLQLILLRGTLTEADMVVSHHTPTQSVFTDITWRTGDTLSTNSSGSASLSSIGSFSPMVALDSSYFIIFRQVWQSATNSVYSFWMELWYWSAGVFTIKKKLQLYNTSQQVVMKAFTATLLDSDHISFFMSLNNEDINYKLFKIQAKGATSAGDSILKITSEIDISGYGTDFPNLVSLDEDKMFLVYDNDLEDSSYLNAEKVEIG